MKNFILGKNEIAPGTKKVVLFEAPNLNMQAKLDIPVHVFHGTKPGPTLCIISGIHGDELNSIEIVRRVHESLRVKKLSGTVITVPVSNVHGVMLQTRYLSDRRDLNRSFPGRKNGTLASRLAYGIMKSIIELSDYGIDLHTGAIGRINMPQLRVDFTTPESKELAKSFNAPVILDSKQREASLRKAASQLGIPIIVYEAGEALRFNELCIRAGVRGIFNVLHYLKMFSSKSNYIHQKSKSVIAKTSRWVRSPASGLFEPVKEVFTREVKKGHVLGYIHDPFLINPSKKIIAPFDGIVIGQSMQAMATEGDALYHIAIFKKIAGVKAYIEEFRNEIS